EMLALAGLLSVVKGSEDSGYGKHGGLVVGDGHRTDGDFPAESQVAVGRATHGLQHRIVCRPRAKWPPGTERCGRAVNDARIEPARGGIIDLELLGDARPKILHDHVGALDQPVNDLPTILGGKVDGETALAAVPALEIAALTGQEWPPGARQVAGQGLNLD